MKRIDIATAHNIVVTHELASIAQRILATCLDIFIQSVFIAIVFMAMGDHAITYFIVGPIPLLYQLLFEVFNRGQSIGKMAMKIRVVSLRGMRPALDELVVRWAFRLLDVAMSLGAVAIVSILSSPKSQRIGDVLGRTAVISLNNRRKVSMKEIQKLNKQEYEIVYPEVVMYSDEDMLLVKEALRRLRAASTEDNRTFARNLARKIADDIGVDQGLSVTDFLRTVLEDYILLSR